MSMLPSRNTAKWAALGIAFTAIVTAATPEKGGGVVKAAQSAAPLQANAAISSPLRAQKRLPEPVYVELERLAWLKAKPEAGAEAVTKAGTETEAEGGAEVESGNIFGATSWYVPPPPPPPPPPAPPPVPTAPPMPFTYLGRYEDTPTLLAILVKGDRMYIVAEGDVIEDTYRIERLTSGMVELTYLPLDIKQSLSTGEAL